MTLRSWMARLTAACALMALAGGAAAQVPSPPPDERAIADLSSDDTATRLRAVQTLKASPSDAAALPLARAVVDADDAVQIEAIGAELNIFLADRVVPRRRVGLIVEVRNAVSAESIFRQGDAALDARPVPLDVLAALRSATHDEHPRVALEALYAFGALSENAFAQRRTALLSVSGPDLAASLGATQTNLRAAALRVIARVYGWRPGDPGLPIPLGDAVVTALNDRAFEVRLAAMDALGAMRYERAVEALTETFRHYERGTAAGAAISALARIAHPASADLFVSALPSRDVTVRLAAIEGLARLGEVAQAPAIGAALASERNDDVRLAGLFADVLLSNGPIDGLVEGLTRPRSHARSLQYLAEALPGRSALLKPHMRDPQPAVRADLLEAAGRSGDPEALMLVDELSGDDDPAVMRAAARARARLGAATSPQP